jgi:hypothetical protein
MQTIDSSRQQGNMLLTLSARSSRSIIVGRRPTTTPVIESNSVDKNGAVVMQSLCAYLPSKPRMLAHPGNEYEYY